MNAPHLDPTVILQWMNASQMTAVMKAGIDLGVFAALADKPATADAVAATIKCPARSTGILLDAMAIVGLATRKGTTYELTPPAAEFLVPGKKMYLGEVSNILAGPMMWAATGQLAEAVRNDGTVMENHAETPSHQFWETFAKSSGALAFPAAAMLADLVAPMASAKKPLRVLDVAAGSGIYGYSLMKHPGVEVTFLDWPNVLTETRAWGARMGVDMARAHYLPGSVFDADLGKPYDLVVASHIFHHFDPKTCQTLTRRLAGALAPGGRLAIHDFITGQALENPGASMFSLVMLVWTRHGKAYSEADYNTWMLEAGLKKPSVHAAPGMPTTWMMGERA